MADDYDNEDMGTSFMRKHMSEAQPSREQGGLGNNPRKKLNKSLTDSAIYSHYGKDADLSGQASPQTVNRKAKGGFEID